MRRLVHIAVAIGFAVGAGALTWARHAANPLGVNDVMPLLVSARALAGGADPYAIVGPGRAFDWPWPQYYPATAFVALLPLAALPLRLAEIGFVALSAGGLTLVVLRRCPERMPILASGAFLWALVWEQWSPALVAAALTPAVAGLLSAKPTTGLALLAGAPSWRAVRPAAIGAALLAAIALALHPAWPLRWLESFGGHAHFVAPITRLPLGPLVLVALLRWRRPEARLLVALACVPQTNAVNDVLPLFLVTSTFGESLLLAVTTHVVGFVQFEALRAIPRPPDLVAFSAYCARSADWLVLGAYLPAVAMVLRRPSRVGDGLRDDAPPPGSASGDDPVPAGRGMLPRSRDAR
jgi:hypothetical protein